MATDGHARTDRKGGAAPRCPKPTIILRLFEPYRVRRAAREIVRTRRCRPFDREQPDGTIIQPPADFQLKAGAVLSRGLNTVQVRWAEAGGKLRKRYADVKERINHVKDDIRSLLDEAKEDPKFGTVSTELVIALVLAWLVAFATILGWAQSWGWVLPLTVIASAALATLEAAGAAAVGAALAALVRADERHKRFRMSPRERRFWLWLARTGLPLLVAFVLLMAAHRGDFLLWAIAGAIGLLLGVGCGAIAYWARDHMRYRRRLLTLRLLLRLERSLSNGYWSAQDHVCAVGIAWLRFAEELLLAGAKAFADEFREVHWDTDIPVPAVPMYSLPTEDQIIAQLMVPLEAERMTFEPKSPTPRGLPRSTH